MISRVPRFLASIILAAATAAGASAWDVELRKMSYERLPDMLVPRRAHSMFWAGGDLVVVGGHTTGFVPTLSAEYYNGGRWTAMTPLYTHDAGFSVFLSSGEVLIGGGFAQNLGIGQTYSVDKYDPATHSFSPFPILDTKRAYARAVEMSPGRVVVSGNWYAPDAIEQCQPGEALSFAKVKDVLQERARPLLLRDGADDLLVLSTVGNRLDTSADLVERLSGEPLDTDFLRTWRPLDMDGDFRPDDCRISGDDSLGSFAYLLPAREAGSGRIGIILVRDGEFSVVDTVDPVPTSGLWGDIYYLSGIYADRDAQAGYMVGADSDGRCYVLEIRYAGVLGGGPASLVLHYTDPLGEMPVGPAVCMLPGGALCLGGGGTTNLEPCASVYVLMPAGGPSPIGGRGGCPWWWAVLGGLAVLALVVVSASLARRPSASGGPDGREDALPLDGAALDDLMARITDWIEEDSKFLRKGLKLSDVAAALGTNTKYISLCVNRRRSCSFTDFVNGYRIAYAKDLLSRRPSIKLSEAGDLSGFSSEGAFFRNFKAATGTTPAQWLEEHRGGDAPTPQAGEDAQPQNDKENG